MFNNQKGKCEYCNEVLEDMLQYNTDDEVETSVIHHVIPLSNKGSNNLKNLSLLHYNCHRLVHKTVGKFKYLKLPYRKKNIKGEKQKDK